jgi:hypothetical protein
VVVNLGMNKDEKGAQHYGEKIIEERQELSESGRKVKERDNLVTSILLQSYLMEPDAMPKRLKKLVAVQGFEPRTLRI